MAWALGHNQVHLLTSKDALSLIDLEAGRDVVELCQVDHQLLHDVGALLQGRCALLESFVAR